VWVLGFTLALGTTAAPAQEEQPSGSPAPGVAAQEEPLTRYRAFRRMHATSERFNQEGWLDAWTELDGRHFRYQIVSERGSEYVRNKVLKGILKKEQQIIAEGDPQRAALTEQNYEFGHSAEGADGLRYVLIKPRRKEVTLVDGRMVLSPDGNELLRLEGRLAKNPSFWTSLVNVIRTFARVDGVRVPVSTESIAKVKFAGQSRLEVSYQYESINGRPVSIAARRVLASAASTTR
jgi:hypothetical protein